MESQARVRRLLRAGLLFLVAFCSLKAQIITFTPLLDVRAGINPSSFLLGDFNGDRRQDLAVTDETAGQVLILRGLGNGLFLPPLITPVGFGPRAIASGDFNRDGRLDLVVANFRSNNIWILRGNGDGTFMAPIIINTLSPSFVIVADFNGDGKQDLAVANSRSASVTIFLGLGDGTFPVTFNFPVGPQPDFIVAADFNGDGKLDLAVSNFGVCAGCFNSDTVSILLGFGTGVFQPAFPALAGENPSAIAATDFNRDGKLDLFVLNSTSLPGTLTVLISIGNGFFLPPQIFFPVQTNPSFLALSDFDGDGLLDVAVANTTSNTVSVLMNLGTGIFDPPVNFTVGNAPVWIVVTDINGDGKPDLLVANRLSGTISVLLNTTHARRRPAITGSSILNGASFRSGSVAPGEIVTIKGQNLGPQQPAGMELTASGVVSATLAGARVLFDGIAAPVIYAQAEQVSAVVPYAVGRGRNTQVQIEYKGITSDPVTIPVSAAAPGVFSVDSVGMGQGAILNQDGTPNSVANPASRGSTITLYGSGEGQTDPPGVDGAVAGNVLPTPLAAVSVSIAGADAEVLYAGAAPGMVAGILQIKVRVPATVSPGDLPVLLTIGNASSQPGITVSVQ
jgi:uncharacterized protein (TIGR03437 family)